MGRAMLTNKQLLEMKDMYNSGVPKKDIASHFNVTTATVNFWSKTDFKKMPCTRKARVSVDIDKMISLYNEGYTYYEISEKMKCSLWVVKDRMKKILPDHRGNNPNTKIRRLSKVKELLEKGYTVRQIAKKLNVSDTTIRNYRRIIYPSLGKQVPLDKLITKNNSLSQENAALKDEVERLKRELEVAYQIDSYDNSDVPALKRRIYDLEETFDAIKQHFNIGLAQMSSVRYMEYEKQESEDV